MGDDLDCAECDALRSSEKMVSDAYLRIRKLLNAWDTPHAPSAQQVYEVTEGKLRALIQERDALRERISMLIEALERSSQHRDTLIGQNDRLRDDMVAIQWKASILRELVREAYEEDMALTAEWGKRAEKALGN